MTIPSMAGSRVAEQIADLERRTVSPGRLAVPTVKPSSPVVGAMYLDLDKDRVYIYRRSGWSALNWE